MISVGSLFSGLGGFDLGLERVGMQVKWQVENNAWCQRILAKHWPEVPKYGDIQTVEWSNVEPVDLICGGWPCQPFSLAGKQQGADDARNMWPEYRRCLEALKPTWVLGENVPGVKSYLEAVVLPDLEALGYETAVLGIPACAVGAPHRRERLWIVAYAQCEGLQRHREEYRLWKAEEEVQISGGNRWSGRPRICRVAHGVRNRMERIKGLGNAVVPAIVTFIGERIMEHDRHRQAPV